MQILFRNVGESIKEEEGLTHLTGVRALARYNGVLGAETMKKPHRWYGTVSGPLIAVGGGLDLGGVLQVPEDVLHGRTGGGIKRSAFDGYGNGDGQRLLRASCEHGWIHYSSPPLLAHQRCLSNGSHSFLSPALIAVVNNGC